MQQHLIVASHNKEEHEAFDFPIVSESPMLILQNAAVCNS